ncbi:MAG TPA: Spy/CpxP family protein refolding chaperone [Pyrinomonadaceae bacterium]
MKATKLIIFIAAIVMGNAALAISQSVIRTSPNEPQQTAQSYSDQDGDELIRAVFDPITDDLKLTSHQKFRIISIASATMAQVEPLFQQIDDLEDQLSLAAFSGQLDEGKIKQVSDKQAALLGEIIAMKARAKANFYKVLTAEQRGIIVNQYRLRSVESLGSISNPDH